MVGIINFIVLDKVPFWIVDGAHLRMGYNGIMGEKGVVDTVRS